MTTQTLPISLNTQPNIRPATLQEVVQVLLDDLFEKCGVDVYSFHVDYLREHAGDLEALHTYALQELESIDAQDTIDRFADERRVETTAAIAYAETLRRSR